MGAGDCWCLLACVGWFLLVRGMVLACAYWRLLVQVLISGLVCGTLSVDGSVCDDSHAGVGVRRKSREIVGDYSKLAVWRVKSRAAVGGECDSVTLRAKSRVFPGVYRGWVIRRIISQPWISADV